MKIGFFCVNLENRKDRWQKMHTQFQESMLDVERFNAIEIKEYPWYGATLSHREIIRIAKERELDAVGVLEDDVRLLEGKDLLKKINSYLHELPENWGLFYLGGIIERDCEIRKYKKNVYLIKHIIGAYGIIYHKNIYDTILEGIQVLNPKKKEDTYVKKYKAIDQWYSNELQFTYPCFISGKMLLEHEDGYSDIDKTWKHFGFLHKKRFFLYKNGLGGWLRFLGRIGDYLGISERIKNKRFNYGKE